MKRILILLAILIPMPVYAEEARLNDNLSISLSLRQDSYSYEHLGSQQPFSKDLLNDKSLVLKIINNKTGWYGFGGVAKTEFAWAGQPLSDITIYSAGIGAQRKLRSIKGLDIYAQIGWYQPITKDLDSTHEAMTYYAYDQVPGYGMDALPYMWPNRSFEIDGNIGGEVGFNLNRNFFFDGLSVGLNGAYRILSLHHYTRFWDERYIEKHPGCWWEFNQTVNHGGWSVGANISYSF